MIVEGMETVELPQGVSKDEAEGLLKVVEENKRYFDGNSRHLVMLALDVIESAELQNTFTENEFSYPEFLDTLRGEWEKVYENYHGLFVKDIGDERMVVFGLTEESQKSPELLAVKCAEDLHKVTENATLGFLIDQISSNLNISREKTAGYLSTIENRMEN